MIFQQRTREKKEQRKEDRACGRVVDEKLKRKTHNLTKAHQECVCLPYLIVKFSTLSINFKLMENSLQPPAQNTQTDKVFQEKRVKRYITNASGRVTFIHRGKRSVHEF